MNPIIKKTILKILQNTYDKIEADTCGLDEDEIMSIVNVLSHVKINIEQTCKHLNCSRATLGRMIVDGRVPPPKKDVGGKEYWYQDELDAHIKAYKAKYHIK